MASIMSNCNVSVVVRTRTDCKFVPRAGFAGRWIVYDMDKFIKKGRTLILAIGPGAAHRNGEED